MKRSSIKSFFLVSFLVTGIILLVFSCSKESSDLDILNGDKMGDFTPAAAQSGQNYVANEILVRFKAGTSGSARLAALSRVNGTVAEKILTNAMKHSGDNEGITLVRTPMASLDALNRVKGLEIEFAEPNWIYTHNETSNDPYFLNGNLWGMYGDASTPVNVYGSQAVEAWANNRTGSNKVYVGIIDEGYMHMHEDITDNAGNPEEISGDGIDNDDNGFVDDVFGWDFVKNDNTVFDGTSDDHGTHVAGTIGAKGGNGKGVAGVCWSIKLLGAKFLGTRGGTTANAIKAVDYFTDLKLKGINIVATNNSWGGGGYSTGLYDAIQRANDAGILFIAAAGNDGRNIDSSPSYPASYGNPNIIAVASINKAGGLSSWSNYGSTSVDIGAPGEGIYSCLPKSSKGKVISGYGSYSGTSMATPHVTGAAALYAASHSGATAAEIKSAILGGTIPTGSISGKCVTGGRLNVSGF